MVDIEEYMRKNPFSTKDKKSKLFQFEKEIKGLREAGATYAYIQKFLAEHEINSSIVNIRQFLIRTDNLEHKQSTQDKINNKPIKTNTEKTETDNSPKEHPKSDYKAPSWSHPNVKLENLI
ncbi:hypothetical protein V757_05755 [Pelistega indica]|uniref:Uncharacterized protein n=1 Tax=Pelistega indica TaxID=1414851 RepID=V8G711_9BURK|nr:MULTISPECIES: hypothetical protein [Pelistega]ETD72200.1 hypothetical protein V757_05755 [Pelistega indica]